MTLVNNKYCELVRPLLDKKSHTYIKDGNTYTSVTKFVKHFFTDFNELAISKYVAAARRRKGEIVTASQVRKEWKKIAKDGTTVHKHIEEYINEKRKGVTPEMPSKKAYWAAKALDGLVDLNHGMPIPEMVLHSDKYKIAGTSDLVFISEEGAISILDWKTNKVIRTEAKQKGRLPCTSHLDDCNFIHYTLQLSVYSYLFEMLYGIPVTNLRLIHLKDDGFQVYPIVDNRAVVQEMLESWQKD
jgi:hypothetical protein